MRSDSPLELLFGGFFHQDWRRDGPTAERVLQFFIDSHPPGELERVEQAVTELLDRNLSESELREILVGAGMEYSPPASGQSYRDFLVLVGRRLSAAVDT
jgi:uncharacterized protein (DUF2267 family)